MQIVLIAAAAGALLLLMSKGKTPDLFSARRAPPGAPGPSAQARNPLSQLLYPLGLSPQGSGGNQGSPNSTLTTVNGTMVVANNALGFFQHLGDYTGAPRTDSEYSVPLADGSSNIIGPDQLGLPVDYTADQFYVYDNGGPGLDDGSFFT